MIQESRARSVDADSEGAACVVVAALVGGVVGSISTTDILPNCRNSSSFVPFALINSFLMLAFVAFD